MLTAVAAVGAANGRRPPRDRAPGRKQKQRLLQRLLQRRQLTQKVLFPPKLNTFLTPFQNI